MRAGVNFDSVIFGLEHHEMMSETGLLTLSNLPAQRNTLEFFLGLEPAIRRIFGLLTIPEYTAVNTHHAIEATPTVLTRLFG